MASYVCGYDLVNFAREHGIEYQKDAIGNVVMRKGVFTCKAADNAEEDGVYKLYYDFSQPISRVMDHQILAINRGEKEGFLKPAPALPGSEGAALVCRAALKPQRIISTFVKNAAEAFDFVLDSPFIDAVAVGMQSYAEVDANIEYFNSRQFSREHEKVLSEKCRVLHVEEYCEGCGACKAACPAGAIFYNENGLAEVNHDKCLTCGYCSPVCPVRAVIMY